MSEGNEIPTIGYSPTEYFSPADFADADESRPITTLFDIGASHSTTPFTTATNNFIARHVFEIREKLPPAAQQFKKRLRDFFHTKTNDLFEVIAAPLAKHPTLGPAEVLVRKFSRGNFHTQASHLRDLTLDVSGATAAIQAEIEASLQKFPHTLKGFQEQTRFLLELYKSSGEEIVRQDTILQTRLELFDKVQLKIRGIVELQENEFFEPLAAATQNYLEKIYEDNSIHEAYTNLMNAYRRFLVIREIVHIRSIADISMSEPLCSICCTEPILFVLTPCGHTFCSSCIKRQITQCYICRQSVKDRVRLFIS
jgi:Zinc finger, C3HC4 type (RING finger)